MKWNLILIRIENERDKYFLLSKVNLQAMNNHLNTFKQEKLV